MSYTGGAADQRQRLSTGTHDPIVDRALGGMTLVLGFSSELYLRLFELTTVGRFETEQIRTRAHRTIQGIGGMNSL